MSTPVQITSLDFDAIKDDIKLFLSNQSEFSDFDFDGSAMSVILDILAYVTHYVSLQANMSFAEMYLDSASLRNNIISRVKELNYVPGQKTASSATITLSLTDTSPSRPSSITLPKGTRFTSIKDDETFFFSTTQEEILTDDGAGLYEKQFALYQGEFLETKFVVDNSVTDQKFVIQDLDVDVSFLNVYVKQFGSLFSLWKNEVDITSTTKESEIWFYEETFDKKIEIYFGNDILGVKPLTGEEIRAEYLVTSGSAGNGISNFQLSDNVQGYNPGQFSIVVDQKSQQGTDEESIERIKLVAPKVREAQNRAVTVGDYRALLINKFPFIASINVWGGEDAVPAQYGKVFISIRPEAGSQLSPQSKKDILEYIQQLNVVGILPEIIEPQYILLNVEGTVKYKGLDTELDNGAMNTLVQDEVTNFINSQASNFNDVIYFSDVVRDVNETENSIEANLIDFTLSSEIVPTPFASQGFVLEYGNRLEERSLSATYDGTSANVYELYDDGNGTIILEKDSIVVNSNQGSIDYINGIVTLNAFAPDIDPNTTVNIKAKPSTNDIISSRKTLFIAGDVSNLLAVNISNQV